MRPRRAQVMADPVHCADGFVYDRSSLEAWFAQHGPVSPRTGAALPHTHVSPSQAVRRIIAAHLPGYPLKQWSA